MEVRVRRRLAEKGRVRDDRSPLKVFAPRSRLRAWVSHPVALPTLLLLLGSVTHLAARGLRTSSFADGQASGWLPQDDQQGSLLGEDLRPMSVYEDADGIRAMRFSSAVPSSQEGKKLVALVEVRNAAEVLPMFLRALGMLVDSVVVLDDHSTDASRELIAGAVHDGAPVELLLVKSGEWIREELFDRQVLLRYGRSVGGTHFVLPDYDEYFSSDCVTSGTLRDAILGLRPGESLALRWVELWKFPWLQAVREGDSEMNFLTRRQTIIFADDGKVSYTLETAAARNLGMVDTSRARNAAMGSRGNASIHALRCPRSLCPPPPKYRGPSTPLSASASVKTLPQCRIVELRFMNMANLLLKAAWYELLGRVYGAGDKVSRGKMFDVIPDPTKTPLERKSEGPISVAAVDPAWLGGYEFLDAEAYSRVEIWRARDVVAWGQGSPSVDVDGLRAFPSIDVPRLESILNFQFGSGRTNPSVAYVPRSRVDGSLLLVLYHEQNSHVLRLLKNDFGGVPLSCADASCSWSRFTADSGTDGRKAFLQYERWSRIVLMSVYEAVGRSSGNSAFISCGSMSLSDLGLLLEMLSREAPELDCIVLSSSSTSSASQPSSAPSRYAAVARNASLRGGSSIRAIEYDGRALGSLAGVFTLHKRLRQHAHAARHLNWTSILMNVEEFRQSREYLALSSLPGAAPPVSQLIFSLNVGRSGSKYISDLVGSVRDSGLLSLHEPVCPDAACSGGGAMPMQHTPLASSYAARAAVKLPMIRSALANTLATRGANVQATSCTTSSAAPRTLIEYASGACTEHTYSDVVYSETNPNFKSWMYDVILDTLPSAGHATTVLVLRKYLPAAVRSLHATGYFRSRDGYTWMETANGANALLRPLATDSALDATDRLISYVLNAELVTRAVARDYAHNARFVYVRAEDVYSVSGALRLLHALELHPGPRTLAVAGKRRDKYERRTRRRVRGFERRVQDYVRRCREAGVVLPEMEHGEPFPGFDYDAV